MIERLLLDEMLAGLARLLRSGGHDAGLAEAGTPDEEVAARAASEGRRLVTRDRLLAARVPGAVLLTTDGTDAQAAELIAALGLDPAPAPFARCVVDNALVRPATEVEAERAAAPAGAEEAFACPACGRVYWAGSHVRRMAARLDRLRGYSAGAVREAGSSP